MKKSIPKNLSKKYLHPRGSELFKVNIVGFKFIQLADWNPRHALHDHHIGATKVPIHLRDDKQW